MFSGRFRGLTWHTLMRNRHWLLTAMLLAIGPQLWAQTPVTVVSAASSSGNALAPDCAAAAYGQNLATGLAIADKLPLPTTLGGTTVKVNGIAAQLFFVFFDQVNFIIPKDAGTGDATIEITSGNGIVSRGTFRLNRVGPAIFSQNNGSGPPVAYVLRYRNFALVPNEPPISDYDSALGKFVPRAIDLGPPEDLVFLVFYLSGIRNAPNPSPDGNVNRSVSVIIGGSNIQPEYAGASPDLAGADQINLIIPRSLIGRGRISMTVTSEGAVSNQVELVIATPPGSTPPNISGFSAPQVLAGQTITVNGSGFSTNAAENLVRIADVEARVVSGSATQLVVEIPFGVKTGKVSVSTPRGEGVSASTLGVKTSVSGFVVDTSAQPQPLRSVLVRAKVGDKPEVAVRTTDKGTFVLPDMEPGTAFIQVDGSSVSSLLPYTSWNTKVRISPNQDNRFDTPIALQQITGNSINLSSDLESVAGKQKGRPSGSEVLFQTQTPIRLTAQDVALDIPAGAKITTAAGTPATLSLTIVAGSRVPTRLPEAVFSSRIVQVTPFGAKIDPGAKLTFPNSEAFPPGTKLDLYGFNKDAEVNIQDGFVKLGTATVSADGQRVETATDAIKETSYFFAALRQLRTTAIGQIVENNKPMRQALVQVRGQTDFTDGNGGFVPRDVAVPQTGNIQAEAVVQRPNGRVEYNVFPKAPTPGGITDFGRLSIDTLTSNLAPVLLVPTQSLLNVGQPKDEPFTAYDPDEGQTIRAQFTLDPQSPNANRDPRFAQLELKANGDGLLKFNPQERDIGEYALTISVEDSAEQKLVVRKVIAISVVGTPGVVTLDQQPMVACESTFPSGPSVKLTWMAAPRATAYDVIRGTSEVVGSNITETSFTDLRGLTAGGNYTYRVVAKNPAGSGLPSNQVPVQIPQNICASKPVTISFDTITGTPVTGGTIVVPVLVGDLSGRNVIAYEFDLGFDSGVLQFLDTDIVDTLSSGMNVVKNPSGNVLKVAAFVGTPVGGPVRTLIRLRFMIKGSQGATTPLRWLRFLLNEGDPLPSTKDDNFTVR